ncbi:very short patch repair endonuclease [Arenimonas fontis]|uniref:Very short patch repair endonuclease n=1 Tax=Arenimonas fontis TaxID=2608255 RepID=A0A5B2ZAV2_9GAMM|nr:very short patch repair endonuclease [Arenimonas fontis]KAA2285085.1 DNA mismatch endonuclease Vsr [Arenimonas fontis]
MDRLPPQRRSWLMSRVRSVDTGPELLVRSVLHRLGFRFRLHRRDLPGTPDIVLPGRRTVVFVHGCFWHGHRCKKGRIPKTRVSYWRSKIEVNRKRDARVRRRLRAMGWRVLTVRECEIRDLKRLEMKLLRSIVSKHESRRTEE